MQASALQDGARIASRGLFRSLIRECRRFPDVQTRTHFIDQARVDLGGSISSRGYEAQQRHLRWLQAANAGYMHAVQRCMGIAHGQRGKLRRRRIEEVFQEARDPNAAELQPGNPRTRLPVYTPRLEAYLTSPLSYAQSKAPSPSRLDSPIKLPERSNPNSEEARLLGRLSPRREANIRWRALTAYRGRLTAPSDPRQLEKLATLSRTFKLSQTRKTSTPVPLTEELKDRFKEDTRRYRKQNIWVRPKVITSRFMRRRYEQIVDKATYLDATVVAGDKVRWDVKQSEKRRGVARRYAATKEDLAWTPPL